jgi:hypothetical protein
MRATTTATGIPRQLPTCDYDQYLSRRIGAQPATRIPACRSLLKTGWLPKMPWSLAMGRWESKESNDHTKQAVVIELGIWSLKQPLFVCFMVSICQRYLLMNLMNACGSSEES